MAGSRFIDLVTDSEEITQVRGIRSTVKRLANDLAAHICGMAEWSFLWTTDSFQTVAPYETGTCTVTDGDATVTFGTATITAAMVGRKIRFGSETAYYTIKSRTSSTEIELEQAYSGTTDSAATFSIYKDEYLLRADVDVYKRLRDSENGYAIFGLSATELDRRYPIPTGESSGPAVEVYVGRAVKTYSTGTVAMTSGTRTLTGTSTAWLSAEGVGRGTKIKIGTSLFTVNTVDSDTQITVYEAATSTISASTSYTAVLSNPVVQLLDIPSEVTTIHYRFQRVPAVMDADNDLPDLPYPMHSLIREGMLPFLWRQRGDATKAAMDEATFTTHLNQWMAKYNQPSLDRSYVLQPFSLRRGLAEARWPAGTGVILSR